MNDLLSVDTALERILAAFSPLPAHSLPLKWAFGRTLAADLIADAALPPFDNSSVDGFAVRAADCAAGLPVTLPVAFDIPAGTFPHDPLPPGSAARIMTGSPIPAGADAIVMVEHTDAQFIAGADHLPATVRIDRAPQPGDNIRRAGEDVQPGQRLLKAGRILHGAELGVLAALGQARITVHRQARVALISTGSELTEPGIPLQRGQIYNANAYALYGLIRQCGAIPVIIPTASDKIDAVRDCFRAAIDARPDLIVSTAGVSVGAFDLVREVMTEYGQIDFWRINLRPGKPLAYGTLGGIPFFGLPGNPVSAQVTFEVFVRPALARLAGQPDDQPVIPVIIGENLRSDGRRSYIRVTLASTGGDTPPTASTTGTQSSGALTSMVYADALMIVPEGVTEVAAGSRLMARLLRPVHGISF